MVSSAGGSPRQRRVEFARCCGIGQRMTTAFWEPLAVFVTKSSPRRYWSCALFGRKICRLFHIGDCAGAAVGRGRRWRDHRSGALPHDRARRNVAPPAGRFLHPVDLAGKSSFRPGVLSHAGAQGVAQFMPGTAHDRGPADPFDPEQAIPKSAALLSDCAAFRQLGPRSRRL